MGRELVANGADHRPDRLIAELAKRQHGVVAASQLHALGIRDHQIQVRKERGGLHVCHRGVYAVGHRNLSRHGQWMAAVLACGAEAALSHHSAAAIWGLRGERGTSIHVAVARPGGRARRSSIVVHRIATMRPEETTRRDGIPTTSPARTLLDLANDLGARELERAIDEAERRRLCAEVDLYALLDAHPGARGSGALRRVLASHDAGSTLTRSELEERFLALCRRERLAVPEVNASVLGLTVDFLWRLEKLVVEVDGHASHGTRAAFERDRDRDSLLAAHGCITLRFTWRDLTVRQAVVAHRLRRVLAARSR